MVNLNTKCGQKLSEKIATDVIIDDDGKIDVASGFVENTWKIGEIIDSNKTLPNGKKITTGKFIVTKIEPYDNDGIPNLKVYAEKYDPKLPLQ